MRMQKVERAGMVSVIMPVYNEKKYISKCLDSISATTYPQAKLEVIVVDGMSSDGTRDILADYAQQHPFIRVVDNPAKIKPRALNIGIQEAKGDIIIRMDAHTVYDPEYISKCVSYLSEYGADNVGGIRKTLSGGDSVIARAIAYSISHPFAAGTALYRTGATTIRWVDTVFGGCYPREVFDRIGLFDEALIRGQDREFNVRLQRAGGKILLAPDIVCHYFARGDYKSFVNWTYACGLTPIYISRITGRVIFSWRNLAPQLFVLGLVFGPVLSLVFPVLWWVFGAVVAVYLAACIYFSALILGKERDIRLMLAMPLIFATTHIFYGVASLVAIFKPIDRLSECSKA